MGTMTVGGKDYWLEWLHPRLPCGLNEWEIDGDEIDGAGVNEPFEGITYFETLLIFLLVVMTDEYINYFDEHCADLTVPKERDTVCIRGSGDTLVIGRAA
jgi:hypothetical protein